MKLKEVKYRFKYKKSLDPDASVPDGWQFLDLSSAAQPFEINEDTLSLFTGFRDSDGREIYFGDIISHFEDFLVVHDGISGLYLLSCLSKIDDPAFRYTVAGNIIDTPDLANKMKF